MRSVLFKILMFLQIFTIEVSSNGDVVAGVESITAGNVVNRSCTGPK
jgi:hypothetical protein